MNDIVAIVGRPNVGKSTLFNKIVGARVSIVHDEPGVTRDRLYHRANWSGRDFTIIDTGGIQVENKPFQEQIRTQALIAIEEASLIVFVVDGRMGVTHDDEIVINILRRSKRKFFVAANMLEGNQKIDSSIYEIGAEETFALSALHGEGVGDLLDKLISNLPPQESQGLPSFKIAIIGRPNAGKSSLFNMLLRQERAIVSPIPGTTRDAINATFRLGEEAYTIIDTAGINKKSKLIESVEHYALARAFYAIEQANLVLMVIDAQRDIAHFDAVVGGYADAQSKPVIIVVNKWDLVSKETNTMNDFSAKIYKNFKFLSWAPIVFISAKSGARLNTLEAEIRQVTKNISQQIKTPILNEVINEVQMMQPAPPVKGGRLQVHFVRQITGDVPTFTLFVNSLTYLHFSYERFLENELRKRFNFSGTPIRLLFKGKEK